MKLFYKLTIFALCASIIYAQDNEDKRAARELADIASSLKDFDDLDGDFLVQMNKKRELSQLNSVEYDSGLIKLANEMSFDMARGDELFRPEVTKSEKISLIGCAIKIHNDDKVTVERKCFGDLFNTEENNNDCALFDEQKEAKPIQKYGFGREINPESKNVYIVRLMGVSTENVFKPVEVEVQPENEAAENNSTSAMPIVVEVKPEADQPEVLVNEQKLTPLASPVELKESESKEEEEEEEEEKEKREQAQLVATKLALLSAALRPEPKEEEEEEEKREQAQSKLSKAPETNARSEYKEQEEEEKEKREQAQLIAAKLATLSAALRPESREEEEEKREQAQSQLSKVPETNARFESKEEEDEGKEKMEQAKLSAANLAKLSAALRPESREEGEEEDEEEKKEKSQRMNSRLAKVAVARRPESRGEEEEKEEEEKGEEEKRGQAQNLRARLIAALREKSKENEEASLEKSELERAAAKAKLANLFRLNNRLKMLKNTLESRTRPNRMQQGPIIRDDLVRTEEETIIKTVKSQRKHVARDRRNAVLTN